MKLPRRSRLGVTRRAKGRLPLWLAPLAILLLAVGCNTGAYPFDILQEMHYQSSFRFQESPRLYPPKDSVPTTGKELAYDFAQAADLTSPTGVRPDMERGRVLFQTNCSMCHGTEGHGDGPVGKKFVAAGVPSPVDFSQPRTKARKPGELWWIMTNGLGNMPSFKNLISEEDRWQLTAFISQIR